MSSQACCPPTLTLRGSSAALAHLGSSVGPDKNLLARLLREKGKNFGLLRGHRRLLSSLVCPGKLELGVSWSVDALSKHAQHMGGGQTPLQAHQPVTLEEVGSGCCECGRAPCPCAWERHNKLQPPLRRPECELSLRLSLRW